MFVRLVPRREVVGALVIDRVDVGELDEVVDRDRTGRLGATLSSSSCVTITWSPLSVS
jgi:hypothetical protein